MPAGRRDRRRVFDVGAAIEAPSFSSFRSGRENPRAPAAAGAPTPASPIDELLTLVNLLDRATDRVSDQAPGGSRRGFFPTDRG